MNARKFKDGDPVQCLEKTDALRRAMREDKRLMSEVRLMPEPLPLTYGRA